jgi:hypothetical protein
METTQMSINKGFLQNLAAPVALAMAILISVQPVLAAVTVGQTASADARVDGIRVPSGTTLISPAVVETGDSGAVLHLSNGEVVAVAPQSTAVVASVDGGVQLAVQKGNVAYTDKAGEVATLSTTETMLVSQEGEIQEGARMDTAGGENERLCELQDWTSALWQTCRITDPKDKDCEWDYLEVPMSEVPQYLDRTALLACKDRNDLDLDCDCKNPKGAFAWWIPVAAIAGGAVLYTIIEEDDEDPASPSQP